MHQQQQSALANQITILSREEKKHRYLLVLIMRYKLSYGAGLGSGKKHLHIKLFLQGSATNSTIPISL